MDSNDFPKTLEEFNKKKAIIELEAKIEQSLRCQDLIEANANSPEDEEHYGKVVLLDFEELEEELKELKKEDNK